jgi:o-succinylbenzoate synthase
MIIQHADFSPYCLPLQRHWVSHQGALDERRGWLITLQTSTHSGSGDCAPLPLAGTETHGQAQAWLNKYHDHFIGQDVETMLGLLDSYPDMPSAVRCGTETALIDLLVKQQATTIAQWLNPQATAQIQVNANLGTLDKTLFDRLSESQGYSVIKLKLGVFPLKQEIEQLQRLAERIPAGVSLRLDANRAWNMDDARVLLQQIDTLPVESIEEPLSEPDLGTLYRLQQHTPIPLALDESLNVLDINRVLQQPPVKRLTIKPMILGGLKPSLELARHAYDAGMEVVVTTTVDSAVGVWATAHLAAALGERGTQIAHGLATSNWLAEDVAQAPAIINGMITLF